MFIVNLLIVGVGRFTPLIPGRQRPRMNRGGTGRRGRPPGSGKRARVTASAASSRESNFLSPEANKSSDISSNNGMPPAHLH